MRGPENTGQVLLALILVIRPGSPQSQRITASAAKILRKINTIALISYMSTSSFYTKSCSSPALVIMLDRVGIGCRICGRWGCHTVGHNVWGQVHIAAI